jgi:3-dehydroquinate dehydratase
MKKVLMQNRPNLNRLGLRKPEHYGTQTLEQLNHAQFVYPRNLSAHCFRHTSYFSDIAHDTITGFGARCHD